MVLTDITIERLATSDIYRVSVLLAESMCTNPNHISIFGDPSSARMEKQRKMFEMVLSDPKNTSFVAKVNDEILGSMTYTTSDYCQLSKYEIFKSLPKYIKMFGRSLAPVLKWRKNWANHDLASPHVHFGPLAVQKSYQGKGVGKLLLSEFCQYLDESIQVGYLETDKKANVSLYEYFGFKVIATDELFGARNWFLVRQVKKNRAKKDKESQTADNHYIL